MKFEIFKDEKTNKYNITGVTFDGDEAFSTETLVFPAEVDGNEISGVDLSIFNCCTPIKIEFEEGITRIGGFKGNRCITEIKFPKSIVNIAAKAFYDCSNLKKVTFPEHCSLTTISELAFGYTAYLESIEIPSSVFEIGNRAFAYSGAKTITFENKCSNLSYVRENAFAYNRKLKHAELPDSKNILHLGGCLFSECTALNTFKFVGDNVEIIPREMFFNCNNLVSVSNIPSRLKIIQTSAFIYCSKLEYLNLKNTQLETIKNQAFFKAGVRKVDIPDTVKHIGAESFQNSMLEELTLPNSLVEIGLHAFYNSKLKEIKNIQALTKASLGDECFSYNNFETLCLPPLNDSLCRRVFAYNDSLTTVKIDYGSTTLPVGLFTKCGNINSLTLPETVRSISNQAFMGCCSLAEVDLENVEHIGAKAFAYCGLTSFNNKKDSLVVMALAFLNCELTSVKASPYAQIDKKAFSSSYGIDYIDSKVF